MSVIFFSPEKYWITFSPVIPPLENPARATLPGSILSLSAFALAYLIALDASAAASWPFQGHPFVLFPSSMV